MGTYITRKLSQQGVLFYQICDGHLKNERTNTITRKDLENYSFGY